MAPERSKVFVPSLVRPIAPPPLPEESAMISDTVKLFPTAFVVSNPMNDPEANPPEVPPLAPPRFVSSVVTFAVLNSPEPPTFKAKVPPPETLILLAVQFAVVAL